jgi:hypothetical protein
MTKMSHYPLFIWLLRPLGVWCLLVQRLPISHADFDELRPFRYHGIGSVFSGNNPKVKDGASKVRVGCCHGADGCLLGPYTIMPQPDRLPDLSEYLRFVPVASASYPGNVLT